MLFKLEESGFIICVCLILLTSCIIMYYFHTRASMIETSIARQNKVLADFFSTFQNDLRRNVTDGGDSDHLEELSGKELNEMGGAGEKSRHSLSTGSLSKIEVSDDEVGDDSGIKLVKVSQSQSQSDSDSDSDSGCEPDSDSECDHDSDSDSDFESESGSGSGSGSGSEMGLVSKSTPLSLSALESVSKEMVCIDEELDKDGDNDGKSDSVDIKEIFICGNSASANTIHENISNDPSSSALMIMLNSLEREQIKPECPDTMKKCLVEEVVVDESNENEVVVVDSSSSSSSNKEAPHNHNPANGSGLESLKKLKLTKVVATKKPLTEKEKENTKKEGVVELRNKVVLLGLVSKEDSSKLKKSEILELLNK